MKDVCVACKYAKPKQTGIYCIKYGIIIYQPRIYCVAYERDVKVEQVRKQENRG